MDLYADPDSITTSGRDMWKNLVKRWVKDYSWTRYNDDGTIECDQIKNVGECDGVVLCLRLDCESLKCLYMLARSRYV